MHPERSLNGDIWPSFLPCPYYPLSSSPATSTVIHSPVSSILPSALMPPSSTIIDSDSDVLSTASEQSRPLSSTPTEDVLNLLSALSSDSRTESFMTATGSASDRLATANPNSSYYYNPPSLTTAMSTHVSSASMYNQPQIGLILWILFLISCIR
ncbi:hypothetical protein BGZ63DRAFT_172383 [Mariannaea sp. PMI_226]|nr:hypothetical protein BGZ63DRAFT_172383 [Mariannaea sp. PMI_226]